MTSPPLDQQIKDASGLVSLLLVFVFAYFSALLPVLERLRHEPSPAAADDRVALRRRLAAYRLLVLGLFGLVVLVLALLGPLTWHDVHAQLWRPFRTLRVGLLLVDVLLLSVGLATAAEAVLLTRRRRQLGRRPT